MSIKRPNLSISRYAAVLIILSLAGCSDQYAQSASPDATVTQDTASADAAIAVEGYEIAYGSLFEAIEASGIAAGIREAEITSNTQGVIQEMLFDLGSAVHAGDAMLRFDDRAEAAALRQAEQQLEAVQLDYEAVRRRLERGSSSQAELTQARAAVAGAESAREQALRSYENHTIRAPISGYIADYAAGISVGNSLSPGARVARVVDTSRLKMRIGAGERSVARIAPGSPVEVFLPSIRSEPFPGRVRSIGAGTDPATGSFPVIVEWDNPADEPDVSPAPARSGISGTVRISNGAEYEQLIIPTAALHGPERDRVLIADNGTEQQRRVSVIQVRGSSTAVSDGVEPGEIVITSAISSIEDDAKIDITVLGSTADMR